MKAPDKIYIAETPNKLIEIWSEEPIESKPYITEHEYIRKDALLEKLNRARELRIKGGQKESSDGIRVIDALTDLINRI